MATIGTPYPRYGKHNFLLIVVGLTVKGHFFYRIAITGQFKTKRLDPMVSYCYFYGDFRSLRISC